MTIGITALIIGGVLGAYFAGSQWMMWGGHFGDEHGAHHHEMHSGGDEHWQEHMGGGPYGAGGLGPMSGMMADMMVESERAFITRMIPHHQEAVNTAREVLERGGTSDEIRELARGIIESQSAEIEDMKAWYEDWYGEAYEPTGEYEPMMRELKGLSGEELDRVFLTDMIRHHMGAIMMARSVQPYIEHSELETLTQNIVSSQSREIRQMRSYLGDL